MLGSLAKWLRIFGFDTLYPDATIDDDQVLELARLENRLLITRDKELLHRGKKVHVAVLGIHTTNLIEQLTQVLSSVTVDLKHILTRCTLCNTLLHSVKKKDIKASLPPKVFETRNNFWYCPVCKKYYWMGTHYENMIEKINKFTWNQQKKQS